MKNIFLLTFLFLVVSCSPEVKSPSDWSAVDVKIREKDSLGASRLSKQVEPAVQTWAGYPDVKLAADTLKENTDPNL